MNVVENLEYTNTEHKPSWLDTLHREIPVILDCRSPDLAA